jgi:MFS family permease
MLFTISRLGQTFSTPVATQLVGYFGYMWLAVGAFALMLLGILFLLPVNPVLFSEPPAVRRHNWIPKQRSPFLVALGSLFTPIYFYLIYKYHGEVASLRPSPRILSPWGAVGASFIPLLPPVMMTTLIELLNERAIEQGKRPLQAPWVMFVWSVLFYPQAMAMIQSAINESIAVEQALSSKAAA